jgi:hypothetical protein
MLKSWITALTSRTPEMVRYSSTLCLSVAIWLVKSAHPKQKDSADAGSFVSDYSRTNNQSWDWPNRFSQNRISSLYDQISVIRQHLNRFHKKCRNIAGCRTPGASCWWCLKRIFYFDEDTSEHAPPGRWITFITHSAHSSGSSKSGECANYKGRLLTFALKLNACCGDMFNCAFTHPKTTRRQTDLQLSSTTYSNTRRYIMFITKDE